MLDAGDRVPALALPLSDGTTLKLGQRDGRWRVLYFYPKDNTPGCTTQGLAFNALLPQFHALDADIIGISRDSLKSHANFCAKRGFRFALGSDADGAVCEAFGVIQPKKLYGREYLGIVRSTFLVDPHGRIVQRFSPVKVAGHAQAVLDALQAARAQ